MQNSDNIKHVREWIGEFDEMLASRGKAPEMPIRSLTGVNRLLWGIHRKELMVIAARPSNGKSVLSTMLAWEMARIGKAVYLMSLEMTAPRIIERIFTMEHLIDNYDLMRGQAKVRDDIKSRVIKFKEQLKKTRLVISDMIGRSTNDLNYINEMFATAPDVIIIDHLNEISSDTNKNAAIEKYLDTLRAMAIRKNTAMIVCCQVNRTSRTDDDKRPQLHQLKGAGAIEEKADSVLLLHYEYKYSGDEKDRNSLEINVAKNRHGMTGRETVYFHPEYSRLSDDGVIFDNSRGTSEPIDKGYNADAWIGGERREESGIHSEVVQRVNNPGAIASVGDLQPVNAEDIVWEE